MGGLTDLQVGHWFANARRRYKDDRRFALEVQSSDICAAEDLSWRKKRYSSDIKGPNEDRRSKQPKTRASCEAEMHADASGACDPVVSLDLPRSDDHHLHSSTVSSRKFKYLDLNQMQCAPALLLKRDTPELQLPAGLSLSYVWGSLDTFLEKEDGNRAGVNCASSSSPPELWSTVAPASSPCNPNVEQQLD